MSSALQPRTPTPHPFQTLKKSIDYMLVLGSQHFWVVLNWGASSKANINQHICIHPPAHTNAIHHFNKTYQNKEATALREFSSIRRLKE